MVDICGYELPTNLQNFTQKDLTEVKIFQKVLGGGATFFETPGSNCAASCRTCTEWTIYKELWGPIYKES